MFWKKKKKTRDENWAMVLNPLASDIEKAELVEKLMEILPFSLDEASQLVERTPLVLFDNLALSVASELKLFFKKLHVDVLITNDDAVKRKCFKTVWPKPPQFDFLKQSAAEPGDGKYMPVHDEPLPAATEPLPQPAAEEVDKKYMPPQQQQEPLPSSSDREPSQTSIPQASDSHDAVAQDPGSSLIDELYSELAQMKSSDTEVFGKVSHVHRDEDQDETGDGKPGAAGPEEIPVPTEGSNGPQPILPEEKESGSLSDPAAVGSEEEKAPMGEETPPVAEDPAVQDAAQNIHDAVEEPAKEDDDIEAIYKQIAEQIGNGTSEEATTKIDEMNIPDSDTGAAEEKIKEAEALLRTEKKKRKKAKEKEETPPAENDELQDIYKQIDMLFDPNKKQALSDTDRDNEGIQPGTPPPVPQDDKEEMPSVTKWDKDVDAADQREMQAEKEVPPTEAAGPADATNELGLENTMLREELHRMQNQLIDRDNDLSAAEEEIARLKKSIEENEKQFQARLDDSAAALQRDHVADIDRLSQEQSREYKAVEAAKQAAEEKLEAASSEYEALKKEATAKEEMLIELRMEMKALREELVNIDQIKNEKQRLEGLASDLKESLTAMQTEAKTRQEEITHLRAAHETFETKRQEIAEKIRYLHNLTKDINKYKEEAAEAREAMQRNKKDFEEKLFASEKQMATVTGQLDELVRKHEDALKEIDRYKVEIGQLQNQVKKFTSEREKVELIERRAQVQSLVKEYELKLKKLTEDQARFQKEIEERQTALDGMLKLKDELETSLRDSRQSEKHLLETLMKKDKARTNSRSVTEQPEEDVT